MASMKWMPKYNRWVFDDGRIFRPGRPHEPTLVECRLKNRADGYQDFWYGSKCQSVHVAVAEAFIPNPDAKPTVDHIDRNRSNNNAANLRWATYSEQQHNTDKYAELCNRLGIDGSHSLTDTEREHLRYSIDDNGFRKRKIASARRYAEKHYANGETYHKCPDGHRRWHKPGECPVCK